MGKRDGKMPNVEFAHSFVEMVELELKCPLFPACRVNLVAPNRYLTSYNLRTQITCATVMSYISEMRNDVAGTRDQSCVPRWPADYRE